LGDGTSDALGVFAGCEYIDPTGQPMVKNYWPGTASCTNIKAYVYSDPQTIFKVGVSANASDYVQAAVGGSVDIADPTLGSTTTGKSTSSITAVHGAQTAQVRVLGFVNGEIYDATTNPFPELLVQILQHQLVSEPAGV